MRRFLVTALAGVVATACSSDSPRTPAQPDTIAVPLRVDSAQHAGVPHNHSVHLSGAQEVFTPATPGAPTPAESNAQGQAIFHVNGDSIDYKLIASNIENVIMAHIHCAPSDSNGPVVVWLYPSPTEMSPRPAGGGRQDGVLATGTITPENVLPTSDPRCPGGVADFAALLAQIRAGNAYVNVHTNDGVAPSNQGPGDFPGGEIRGQLGTPGSN